MNFYAKAFALLSVSLGSGTGSFILIASNDVFAYEAALVANGVLKCETCKSILSILWKHTSCAPFWFPAFINWINKLITYWLFLIDLDLFLHFFKLFLFIYFVTYSFIYRFYLFASLFYIYLCFYSFTYECNIFILLLFIFIYLFILLLFILYLFNLFIY